MKALISNLRYKLLAVGIALFLWGVSHGSATIDRGFDIPVVLQNVPEHMVVTDKSADVVNVRVMGRRALLRSLTTEEMEYRLDVSQVKPGVAEFEVDVSRLEFPNGVRTVSRSPSRIEVSFERRGRKTVRVRADLEGEPADGFEFKGVEIEPSRVNITGARSQVLRISEVVTEPIDLSGLMQPVEREVRVLVGGGTVWVDEEKPIRARLRVEPRPAVAPVAPKGK